MFKFKENKKKVVLGVIALLSLCSFFTVRKIQSDKAWETYQEDYNQRTQSYIKENGVVATDYKVYGENVTGDMDYVVDIHNQLADYIKETQNANTGDFGTLYELLYKLDQACSEFLSNNFDSFVTDNTREMHELVYRGVGEIQCAAMAQMDILNRLDVSSGTLTNKEDVDATWQRMNEGVAIFNQGFNMLEEYR